MPEQTDTANPEQAKPRPTVVTLSNKSLATAEGIALLKLLERIMEDGRLAEQEITDLAAWLKQTVSTSTLPGIHFLREEVAGILADGAVSEAESKLLQNAILRVLPTTERERAKARIDDAMAQERKRVREERTAASKFATPKQLEYIRHLGGTCSQDVTWQQASEIIDQLVASSPTVRQRMVLRFWNRLDLSTAGVEGVSAWMDRWYEDDPRRLEAWELWKQESGDNGDRSPTGIDSVPLGAGHEYLKRVKDKGRGWSPIKIGFLIVLGIALLIWWLRL